MVAPHAIDTKNPEAVLGAVKAAFAGIEPKMNFALIDQVFADVQDMFEGRFPAYQGIDMKYHDLEHTLQATVCLLHLLEGRQHTTDQPALKARDWEIALVAVLLHDTGYLKEVGDNAGTGAKYTFIHERRSCDFARGYLPTLGFTPWEIDDICAAIICTGPQGKISHTAFRREEARIISFMLVTADYLAQMSCPHYVEKLGALFREFQEAYEFEQVPFAKRQFENLDKMLEKTPAFWVNYVRPMLDFEAGGVHRYLSTAGQPNPYFEAVEANLCEVQRRIQVGVGHT